MNVVPYLFFNGNCEEAMNFYIAAGGGSVNDVNRFGDAHMGAEEDKNKIMHATFTIFDSKVMCSDTSSQHPDVTFGDNFSMSVDFKSDGAITGAFDAISEGGVVTMPLQDTFWGAKFGMCKDKFGVNWMFNFDKPKA